MYFKNLIFFLRSILRSKVSFFINLIGLCAGLASAMLVFLWIDDEMQMDKFHDKDATLFQVMSLNENGGSINVGTELPPVLAAALKQELPEVRYAVAEGIIPVGTKLKVDEKVLKADGMYAGSEYFDVFSYPFLTGDKNSALSEASNIVISRKLAEKLFDSNEKVLGKAIEFKDDGEFYVSGVVDIPKTSSNQFDFILPLSNVYRHIPRFKEDWTNSWPNAYLILAEGTDVEGFNRKMNAIFDARAGENNQDLFLQKYSDGYLYGKYENGVQSGGRIDYVRLFALIAIFILLIACINFMNLSTAIASKRMGEVGIKKALGASRKSLIFQYLGESLLMSLISLVVAIVLVSLVLPTFNDIAGKEIELNFSLKMVAILLTITIITGLVAGSYPAAYLSGFNPVTALKGKISTHISEIFIRKGLIIFQYMLSVLLIVAVLIIYQQMDLIQNRNLGYDRSNVIYFEMEGQVADHRETFLNEIKNVPGVSNASTVWLTFLGELNSTSGLNWEGKDPNEEITMQYRRVNHGMIELLDIEMKEGQPFAQDASQNASKIIFNQTAIDLMDIADPVGRTVSLWGSDYEIMGVTEDFYFESIHENVKPLFFIYNPERTNTVMIKLESNQNLAATLSNIRQFYSDFTQGSQLDFKFLDALFQLQYQAESRVAILSKYFAGLAILISSLGLFGLTTFVLEKRRREIAIRKTLGARPSGLVLLVLKDFNRLVLLSLLISLPVSYFLAQEWLDSFVLRIDLEMGYFLLATIITVLLTWFTVGLRLVNIWRINIVKALRINN